MDGCEYHKHLEPQSTGTSPPPRLLLGGGTQNMKGETEARGRILSYPCCIRVHWLPLEGLAGRHTNNVMASRQEV